MLRLMSSEAPGKGLAVWIVGFSAFVIAAIIAHAVWFYEQQRQNTIHRALTDAENLASALEEHTRSTVQWTSYSLDALSADIEEMMATNQATATNLRRAVETANRETPEVASFVFAREDGGVISDTITSDAEPVSIADEGYFHGAKASLEGGLYAIAPRWPVNGAKMVIALVRPIRRPDGAFAGAAIGTVDPRLFNRIHEQLDLGKDSTVSVFSRNGIMIARTPYIQEFIGTSFADDAVFQQIAQSSLHGGHYNPQTRDGRARFVAYRTMPDYPLVVAVGKAESEVLSTLQTNRTVMAIYVVVLIMLMGLFAVWMLALARKQERSHQQLVATFDNVNQGVVVFDSHMRVVSFNQQCADMFEFPPGFIRPGLGYLDIVRWLGERGEYPGQATDDVLANRIEGVAQGQEHRRMHHRPNGKVIVIYRKPMAGGGFIITFTDATEEVRLKDEAEKQARQLRLVLDGIHQGIRVFDKDLKLVLANRRFVETFGYPEEFARPGVSYEETVRTKALRGEYGEGDAEKLVSEHVALGRAGINRAAIQMTPNGRYARKQRGAIEGGGFISTYTDVTDLVHAEAELARKSDLLQLTQEHMGDGISVYDADLRLINFNQRWVEIWNMPAELTRFGTSYADIMRRHVAHGFSGVVADPDAYIAKRTRDLLEQRFTQDEILVPDGRTILVRRFTAPNGVVVISHTDISRLKRAEVDAARKSVLLETVLDHMSQGIIVCDGNLRLVSFNEQFMSLLGYEPGDMQLGMSYGDILRLAVSRNNIQTDDVEAFIASREQSAHSSESYREFRSSSGRFVTLQRSPMPGGGFVTTAVDVTNRKKAEMALQASEERYRSLVTSSTQLIWSTDAIGNVVEPLPTWQKFTGQSNEDVLGWGWIQAVHPDDTERVRASWLTALETKSICNYEYRVRRYDGIYRTFSARGVPVINSDGSLREWVGVSEDISERKAAEAEVEAKSKLFEATLQNMAQGITVYDRDFRLVAFNQRYIDLFGFPPGFIRIGRAREDILRYLAPQSVSQTSSDAYIARRMVAARKGESFQREFTRANGRTVVVGHTAMPDGGFINTFTDITDRKRAEQALQDSEQRLRAILDNVADAIITTDKAGLIQSCNLAAATIFGYSVDEAIGMDIRHLIPNPVFQPRNQASSGAGPSETMACRKSGELFPIDIAVTSIELAGRWLQIAIVRDIEEQKVLQAQLYQAAKLATLGEMAAAMAHEMNQPLNVMRMAADNGLARMDRKLATEEYLRQNLGLISSQAERLGKLIMHMRVFSRVDPTEFELFDPRASVAAAVDLMGQQLALNNVTVTTAFPTDCGEVLGLPSQLEQVVINLLSNAQDAITAHPRSSPPTCIGAITLSMVEDEGMVRIKVADTGGGIPPDVIGRVFDPFFTTKEVGKGTGLGLSVSYGIIAAMGGKIDVFSSDDGAEFTVLLPTRHAYGARDQNTQVGS